MSILEQLGLRPSRRDRETTGSGDSKLAMIADRFSGMEPRQAQLVAALAMVLARVARADLDVSVDETRQMVELLSEIGNLQHDDAELAVRTATSLLEAHAGTQDYLATREFKRLAGPEDRERLLHCLFAVCAADDSISSVEEEEVRQVALELGFEHQEYTRVRSSFRDKREVLRGL